MEPRSLPDRFLVAISFAGEERALIEPLAVALEARLGRGTVYYDNWYRHYFAGHDADLRMQSVYDERAELVVVGVSGSYGTKPWTLVEYEAVRSLGMRLRQSTRERDAFRILPLRVGDGDVRGIYTNTVDFDIRRQPLPDTVDLVINRLRLACPEAEPFHRSKQPAPAARHVFLAHSTPDLDDPSRPINRRAVKQLLEDLGWVVLPAAPYEEGRAQTSLLQDLARSEAYLQLLGPRPWGPSQFDRQQLDAAAQTGLQRFVFRSDQIDLTTIEPVSHRQWLEQLSAVVCGFDDFLVYVKTRLGAPAAPPVHRGGDGSEAPPLVRVAIHSADRDALWERVFPWISEQQKLLHDQLAPDETFTAKHTGDPCQGFLILCDSQAMEDGPLSPRHSMQQCRQLHISEKDATRRPPVALVYWPPPDAAWAKLLRTTTQNLRYVQAGGGDQVPPEIEKFFDDVRRLGA